MVITSEELGEWRTCRLKWLIKQVSLKPRFKRCQWVSSCHNALHSVSGWETSVTEEISAHLCILVWFSEYRLTRTVQHTRTQFAFTISNSSQSTIYKHYICLLMSSLAHLLLLTANVDCVVHGKLGSNRWKKTPVYLSVTVSLQVWTARCEDR